MHPVLQGISVLWSGHQSYLGCIGWLTRLLCLRGLELSQGTFEGKLEPAWFTLGIASSRASLGTGRRIQYLCWRSCKVVRRELTTSLACLLWTSWSSWQLSLETRDFSVSQSMDSLLIKHDWLGFAWLYRNADRFGSETFPSGREQVLDSGLPAQVSSMYASKDQLARCLWKIRAPAIFQRTRSLQLEGCWSTRFPARSIWALCRFVHLRRQRRRTQLYSSWLKLRSLFPRL